MSYTFIGVSSGILFGAIFLIIGIVVLKNRERKETTCTMATEGEIIDVVYRHDSDGSAYFPVVEYVANGETITKESNFGSNPPKYAVGDVVEVWFNPYDVHEYLLAHDKTSRLLSMIFIIIGSVIIGVSLIVMLVFSVLGAGGVF